MSGRSRVGCDVLGEWTSAEWATLGAFERLLLTDRPGVVLCRFSPG
jgi:hypothetical protein